MSRKVKNKKKQPVKPRLLHPTREEVREEFNKELFKRVDAIIMEACKGKGIIVYAEYSYQNQARIRVEEKIKLLKEWEAKGRNTAFNDEPIGLLLEKQHFPNAFYYKIT